MNTTTTKPTFSELCENAPKYATKTAALASWAGNYDSPNPFNLFMDLIGYSTEEFGTPLCEMSNIVEKLGYLEIDMLADAMKEYADRPQDVYAFVEQLCHVHDEPEDDETEESEPA